MRITHNIIGLAVIASALFPSAASAANVLQYDTASGNGSLFQRIIDGTIEPRVREIQTIKGPDGKPWLNDRAYESNMNELWKYSAAYGCRAKLNLTSCKLIVK